MLPRTVRAAHHLLLQEHLIDVATPRPEMVDELPNYGNFFKTKRMRVHGKWWYDMLYNGIMDYHEDIVKISWGTTS